MTEINAIRSNNINLLIDKYKECANIEDDADDIISACTIIESNIYHAWAGMDSRLKLYNLRINEILGIMKVIWNKLPIRGVENAYGYNDIVYGSISIMGKKCMPMESVNVTVTEERFCESRACASCKKYMLSISEVQDRRADEGVSTYVQCHNSSCNLYMRQKRCR
jgi:hypothetical protein